MTSRKERFAEILGIDVEETPETAGFRLSTEFITQVLLEIERQGLRLKDLAEKMGVTQAAVSSMLNGASNMKMVTVAKLAMALGMEVEPPRLVSAPSESIEVEYTFSERPQKGPALRYETASGASVYASYEVAA